MFELRPYQQEAVDSVDKYFRSGKKNPLLVEPTGAGKSIIIACYIDSIAKRYPQARVLVLTHVKELISQNSGKLKEQNPLIDVGIYSAGLRMKHTDAQFLFAGIATIHKSLDSVLRHGKFDICIVDECHLINPKQAGMYREVLDKLEVPVIGFTATPFRMGYGYIHEGDHALFGGIAHETKIEFLIESGFLVPPIVKASEIHADLSNVGHNSFGEFKESDLATAFDEITISACKDMIKKSADRNCRLVFCSGREHALKVKECLEGLGATGVEYLDGSTSSADRKDLLQRVVAGLVKWVINIGVLTTGFDAPVVDCVIFLRATESTSLYVQIIGRGLRIMEGKVNCLVLDYGENIHRHGPLNDLIIKTKGSEAPVTKECPECECITSARSPLCHSCGFEWLKDCPMCEKEFPINLTVCIHCNYAPLPVESEISHAKTAAETEILRGPVKPVWVQVMDQCVNIHPGRGNKPDTLKVTYFLHGGGAPINEWHCFAHHGYARNKALKWAENASSTGVRGDITLMQAVSHEWKRPKEIKVKPDGKYFKVMGYSYE